MYKNIPIVRQLKTDTLLYVTYKWHSRNSCYATQMVKGQISQL